MVHKTDKFRRSLLHFRRYVANGLSHGEPPVRGKSIPNPTSDIRYDGRDHWPEQRCFANFVVVGANSFAANVKRDCTRKCVLTLEWTRRVCPAHVNLNSVVSFARGCAEVCVDQ
ncbi:hypothetical protein JTB14_006995 [Gonioctena quinquepunctata]|nr:hypothetical protein JTB14_006995 [Gonioctena quinquepunctata]